MIPKELHSVDYGDQTNQNATEKRPEMRELSSNFRVKYSSIELYVVQISGGIKKARHAGEASGTG